MIKPRKKNFNLTLGRICFEKSKGGRKLAQQWGSFVWERCYNQVSYLISPTSSKINIIDLLLKKEKLESHSRLPSYRSRILSSPQVIFSNPLIWWLPISTTDVAHEHFHSGWDEYKAIATKSLNPVGSSVSKELKTKIPKPLC